eukprot:gene3829-4086_t
MSESTTTDGSATTDIENLDSASELQTEELSKAVLLLKLLRKENKQLTKNFEKLKLIHLGLITRHKKLEIDFDKLKQERVAVEQQYQKLCDSWRSELEEKQHQFEQARAQVLQPRDLDLLRLQLLEEVEAPFKTKCQALAQEAEAAQKQYVDLRREHEALQNSIRTQEAVELRHAKEAAVVDKEHIAVRLERRSQQQQVAVQELQVLVDSLTRKNRHLTQELLEAGRSHESTHSQLMQLQAHNTALASQLADAQATAASEKKLLHDQLRAAEEQWQDRIKDLIEQLQLQVLEAQNKAQLEVTVARSEADRVQALLDASQQQVLGLQQQLADAPMQQATLRSSFVQLEAAADPGLTTKIQAAARCVLLEQQAKQLEAQLAEADKRLTELRIQHEQLQVSCDTQLNSTKQAAMAEKERLVAKHIDKVRRLKETAKAQVRVLRLKLKECRITSEQLSSELSNLRVTLNERESELEAVWRQSTEQQPPLPGSPGPPNFTSPARRRAVGLSISDQQHSPAAAHSGLAAALADVRQRQQVYLDELSPSKT